MSDVLPSHASVVIIGAGLIGLSSAAHLAERGVTDVVVLDAGVAGGGSSAKPVGGFRTQFSDATNIAMSLRSIERTWLRFPQRWGADVGVEPVGYLFLFTDPSDVPVWEEAVALQRTFGIESRMIEPHEAARLNPHLDPAGFVAAQIGHPAGIALPARAVAGFATAARRGGIRIVENNPVIGVDPVGDDLLVSTPQGTIRTPTIVIAAGAWSQDLGAMVGLDLPVTPVRRQIAVHRHDNRRPRFPFTIDVASTAHLYPAEGNSLAVGYSDPLQMPGFTRDYDESWLPGWRRSMGPLAPEVANLTFHKGWAGLYEMTPDGNALLGEATESDGRVLYACGLSGHGVMHAPAIGEVIADLYLGSTPFIDISGYSVERLDAGTTGLERSII